MSPTRWSGVGHVSSYRTCVILRLFRLRVLDDRRNCGTAFAAKLQPCHSKVTPNVVADWKLSRHHEVGMACDTCHGSDHMTAADAAKAKIPTAETCGQCHDVQVAQFKKGKHAMAWASMEAMPTIHWQPMAMTEGIRPSPVGDVCLLQAWRAQ